MTISDISIDDGSALDFEKYYFQELSLAIAYEENDPCSLSQEPFANRVHLLSEKNNISIFLVDKLILVRGPSDAIRTHEAKNWEVKREAATWPDVVYFELTVAKDQVNSLFTSTVPPAPS